MTCLLLLGRVGYTLGYVVHFLVREAPITRLKWQRNTAQVHK